MKTSWKNNTKATIINNKGNNNNNAKAIIGNIIQKATWTLNRRIKKDHEVIEMFK